MKTSSRCSQKWPTIKRVGCWVALSFVGLVLSQPSNLRALGFRIPNQDAEATAKGNAFVATADNPSAIYYNPAGITQLEGTHAQLGFHNLSVNAHFESTTPGMNSNTKSEVQTVPQFYFTHTPKDKPYSFGLGVYAPFGLGLQWPEDGPLRNMALEGRLQYITLSPIVAWRVHPTLSIAAGPTLDYSSLMMRQGVGIIPGVDEFHFRGTGFTAGAKLGILWQPHPKWSFGASYFSPTTIKYSGKSSVKPITGESDTTLVAPFPQYVMSGISFRPTPKWNIEVGLDWTDWDSLNSVTFQGVPAPFPNSLPFALNWKSSYLIHSGVERYLANGYWVAAGYFFSQNSTTDTDFSPLVPDTDLHVASLGFGRKGEKWSWAISGQIITGPARNINNSATAPNAGANGSYKYFNQAVNVSIARSF